MRAKAFTLAEVLITLGIIGIVAAMTLPTLTVSIKDKENAAKLKKTYSLISQAYLMAKSELGNIDEWGLGANRVENEDGVLQYNPENASIVMKAFSKYLKTNKICDKITGCWYPDNLQRLDGSYSTMNFNDTKFGRTSMILSDGTLLVFTAIDRACSMKRGGGSLNKVCGSIGVDVNGWTKPNQIGKDIFQFYLTKENVVPYGTKMETIYRFPNSCNTSASDGWGCTAWVIYNENMDYTKCNDLSWDGKTKCK